MNALHNQLFVLLLLVIVWFMWYAFSSWLFSFVLNSIFHSIIAMNFFFRILCGREHNHMERVCSGLTWEVSVTASINNKIKYCPYIYIGGGILNFLHQNIFSLQFYIWTCKKISELYKPKQQLCFFLGVLFNDIPLLFIFFRIYWT